MQETNIPIYLLSHEDFCGVLPVIVSVVAINKKGVAQPLPTVTAAIDKVIGLTGREGLVHARILPSSNTPSSLSHYVSTAMRIDDAFLLLECATGEIAELVMQEINKKYRVSLLSL